MPGLCGNALTFLRMESLTGTETIYNARQLSAMKNLTAESRITQIQKILSAKICDICGLNKCFLCASASLRFIFPQVSVDEKIIKSAKHEHPPAEPNRDGT